MKLFPLISVPEATNTDFVISTYVANYCDHIIELYVTNFGAKLPLFQKDS